MKWISFFGILILLAGCQSGPDGVANKVLADFGLREHPEGYVSGSDMVYQQLDAVGAAELKRLNAESRHGEIKFEGEGVRGKYYKEAKVYESFYPLDAQASASSGMRDRGYIGLIEYRYRIFRSESKNTQAEATAASATVPLDGDHREMYRYNFSLSGVWDGARGERANR